MIELGSVQAAVSTQDFSKSIMNGEAAGQKMENEMAQYGNDYQENSFLSDDSASQLSSNLGKLGKENLVYDANIGTETIKVDMLEEFESDGTTKRTTGEGNNNDNEESQDGQHKPEVIAEGQYESNRKNEENNSTASKKNPNNHFKQPKVPKTGASLPGNSGNAFPQIINSRKQNLVMYPRTKSTTQSSKGTVLISKKGNEAQDASAKISSPASKGSLHRQNTTIPRPFSLATEKRASLGARHSSGEVAGVESRRPIINNVISPFAERRQSTTKSASAVSEAKHLHNVGHKTPSTGASKGRPSSGTSASVSNFRCNERADNKREFNSELEEKFHANEGKNFLQAKKKEQQEGQLEKVRKSLSFKATPMPDFYQEVAPPKPELKKIPPTRPKSPKLGRRNSSIGLESFGNPISARLSLGQNNIKRHLQTPRQDNASKAPSKAKSAVNKTMQSSLTTRPDKSVKTKYDGSKKPVIPEQKASKIPETGCPNESTENEKIPTSKPVNDPSESSTNEEKTMQQEADGVEEKNELKPKRVNDCSESPTNEEKVMLQEADVVE